MGCCVPLDGLWWWCPLVCTHYTHFTLHRPSSSPNQKGEEEGSRKKAKVAALSLLCVYFAVPHNSVRPRYMERIRQNSTLRPFEPPPTSHLFFFFFFFFFFSFKRPSLLFPSSFLHSRSFRRFLFSLPPSPLYTIKQNTKGGWVAGSSHPFSIVVEV